MSVCVEPVLSLDDLELKVTQETKTPALIASYDYEKLLQKRQEIVMRYPSRPGLFAANKRAARKMFLARYDIQIKKAERRIAISKLKKAFYNELLPFDADCDRLDFEMTEWRKLNCTRKRKVKEDSSKKTQVAAAPVKKTKVATTAAQLGRAVRIGAVPAAPPRSAPELDNKHDTPAVGSKRSRAQVDYRDDVPEGPDEEAEDPSWEEGEAEGDEAEGDESPHPSDEDVANGIGDLGLGEQAKNQRDD